MDQRLRVGIAGWSIRREHAEAFPGNASHLARYAARFSAVEINSSFYRPHRASTYARWAATVPDGFLFAIKLPREISHRRRLIDCSAPLDRFLAQIAELDDRLGPLLVQLPPSLRFQAAVARAFFDELRDKFAGDVVCEPRHASWFSDAVEAMLREKQISRVAADPATVPIAAEPGGWPGLIYRRLHGSPHMYSSAYSAQALDATAAAMRATTTRDWCIFDNTALGAATTDALALMQRL